MMDEMSIKTERELSEVLNQCLVSRLELTEFRVGEVRPFEPFFDYDDSFDRRGKRKVRFTVEFEACLDGFQRLRPVGVAMSDVLTCMARTEQQANGEK